MTKPLYLHLLPLLSSTPVSSLTVPTVCLSEWYMVHSSLKDLTHAKIRNISRDWCFRGLQELVQGLPGQ